MPKRERCLQVAQTPKPAKPAAKTAKAVDPVTDAPSPATEAQLKELGIAVITVKKQAC